MKKIVFICTMCLSFAVSSNGQSPFEQRRLQLLEVASVERERGFQTVTAKLLAGRDREYALTMLDSLTSDEAIGGMFYSYSLIGCYLHTRVVLPDSLRKKVRSAYRNRTMYRGDTENHWVTYYTGLYLAAQTWPHQDGTEWFNGKSSSENFQESTEWLNHWIRMSARIGQGEFDSPTYISVFITPMLVLYDFAQDPQMKRKAQMMLDLLFADFAVEHLKGNYAGGHSRDYPEDIVNPLAAPSTFWAWLYFGEPEFAPWSEARFRPRHRGAWEPLFGAVSSYRLPDIIYRIATDRTKPYVQTKTKRVRNIIRFGAEKNPPVFKYTYMTRHYALGSLQGGILQPIQQHTWDVTYASGKPYNTLFTLHPFFSGKELAMFFPEEQKFLSDEVDRYHKVYTNPNKWNSSSPYEQTFQHKNALIVLYNIEQGAIHPHIDGFFPKNLEQRVVDKSGWIFCKAGDTYMAFFPLKPYEWIEEEINWRWRSHELKNGAVVEIGSSTADVSFDRFRKKVSASIPLFKNFEENLTVQYTTRMGDRMKFTFGGERVLNGKHVDFARYRFFDGPYLQSEYKSGIITMLYKGSKRVLDFNEVSITE